MEQREGDPGDLTGHLGHGSYAEGERKGREAADAWVRKRSERSSGA